MKCFTMRLDVEEPRKVIQVQVDFDHRKMNSDLAYDRRREKLGNLAYLLLVIHYPNQYFLLKRKEMRMVSLDLDAVTGVVLEKIEILKQRNSRHRKCSKDIEMEALKNNQIEVTVFNKYYLSNDQPKVQIFFLVV